MNIWLILRLLHLYYWEFHISSCSTHLLCLQQGWPAERIKSIEPAQKITET